MYLVKIANHFLHKGSHRSNVDDFEVILVDTSIGVDVLADFMHDAEKSDVGFTSTLE